MNAPARGASGAGRTAARRFGVRRQHARRHAATLAAQWLIALGGAGTASAQTPSTGATASSEPAQPSAGGAAGLPVYRLDPTHTFVHWEVLHMGTSTIRGRFDKAAGSVRFDAKARALDIGVSIDTASVNSGVPLLDTLLRGAAMLDSKARPEAYFVATAATWAGDAPREIRGEFTLRGTSQPLGLTALRWHCGLNPLFGREVCGGDFEAWIDRSSFGITHSLPFVADRVRLLIQVEAVRD